MKTRVSPFEMACQSNATVLITGPTGTGKSRLARKIHEKSKRRLRPFVVVNLATLYEGVLESELFGHERGSFTGAETKRVGRLEMAQGGTVFLDEVGELRPSLQARLLEFLQTKTISPVGSNREIRLDVRILAATHQDLQEKVRLREFREDLFHRLRVISLPVMLLRERRAEFKSIQRDLLRELKEELFGSGGHSLIETSLEVDEVLENYGWPGNIRELRNTLEYAVLASEGGRIELHHLPSWLLSSFKSSEKEDSRCELRASAVLVDSDPELGFLQHPLSLNYDETCKSFEKQYLQRALFRNGGRINRTARQIGLNKSTLIRRIRSFGLSPESLFLT